LDQSSVHRRCATNGLGEISFVAFGSSQDSGPDVREPAALTRYIKAMNSILLVLLLVLLLGGGGFYVGGPVYGGSALGLVLLICLIVYLMGGFRGRRL
jgi:hypothetical protein